MFLTSCRCISIHKWTKRGNKATIIIIILTFISQISAYECNETTKYLTSMKKNRVSNCKNINNPTRKKQNEQTNESTKTPHRHTQIISFETIKHLSEGWTKQTKCQLSLRISPNFCSFWKTIVRLDIWYSKFEMR